ncbi:putative acyl carrier protein dehydratase [Escherichia coli]|nr:putative acyl carrier protein dehydratase [Escherichia coli]
MIRHEIERHLVQPQEMEIVLYLDPMLYWLMVILPYSLCYQAWPSWTG